MDVKQAINSFLLDIPRFISELEYTNPYVKVSGFSSGVKKTLINYTVIGNEEGGLDVLGILGVSLDTLVSFPGWHTYKAQHPEVVDSILYFMYLKENPVFGSDFNIKEFIETFGDFYKSSLEGVNLDGVTFTNNSVSFNEAKITVEPEVEPEADIKESTEEEVKEDEVTEETKEEEVKEEFTKETKEEVKEEPLEGKNNKKKKRR